MRYPHRFSNPTAYLIGLVIAGLFIWAFNAYRFHRIRSGAKFGGDRQDRILLTCGVLLVVILAAVVSVFV